VASEKPRVPVAAGAAIVQTIDLHKTYGASGSLVPVLTGIDMVVQYGEMVALRGPSGSGKSTLLNILGCLDRPTRGHYLLGGRDVSTLDRAAQAWVRLHFIGFVFQTFHLIPHSTALENVSLPLHYAGLNQRQARERAEELLARVGLADRLEHRPSQLSGGQRQRVAVARSLACRPRLLLADEPTGALDTRTGQEIMELLQRIQAEDGLTILIVTHDPSIARLAQREVVVRDGRLVSGAAASEGDSQHALGEQS
jgi:putative ABC transport system ATP-binding protein